MGTGRQDLAAQDAVRNAQFDETSVVTRVRRGLAEAGLDCRCEETANAVLDRIGKEGDRASREVALGEARKMRDAILILLTLLGELDEITVDEPDKTSFQEIAGLFRDMADFAAHGADSTLRAIGQRAVGN
ncbi:MAG: hypothetical protein WDZ83_08160 [Rhizobiaceae bacterium]